MARALNLSHVAAATGRTSEEAVQALYNLPDQALIDMGDFAGGTLKYLRRHPVPRVTIAGGPAKMTKLAQGRLDLHSKRGAVDAAELAAIARKIGADDALTEAIANANTTLHAFELAANLPLAAAIAAGAHAVAQDVLGDAPIALDIVIFDRTGQVMARHPAPS